MSRNFLWLLLFCFVSNNLALNIWPNPQNIDEGENDNINIIERSQTLSPKYFVSWTVDFVQKRVTFNVTGQTTGFIGFGLSSQGSMTNADVVIGGIDGGGQAYFTDRWATTEAEPMIDDHQDWILETGAENSTHTTLTFYRSFDTCDDQDLMITNDTIKFIWSLGATDKIEYHADRGTSSVNILDDLGGPSVNSSIYDIWDITVNTTIPTVDTTYWCTIHKSPDFGSKQHIVGFKVKLENNGSMEHNHHLALHKCLVPSDMTATFDRYIDHPGGDCYENDESGMNELLNYCRTYVMVWAKGGEPLFLPENVGFPVNENGQEFFLMEIHYDNPKILAGVSYDTGLQIFTTSDLRDEDAGLLMIGHPEEVSLVIPPQMDDYMIVGHCSPRCTAQEIPKEGINAVNVLLHSHLAGRKLKVRHFRPIDRNDTSGNFEELPWISYDNNYDFDYQQNRPLIESRKILPGDHLTYECNYNTKWRNPPSVTLGGLATRNEMCVTYLLYYPKLDYLDICGSQHPRDLLAAKFGVEKFDETSDTKDPLILEPVEFAGKNYSTILNGEVSWTDGLVKEIQQMTRFNDHEDLCVSFGNFSKGATVIKAEAYFTKYPKGFTDYTFPQRDCPISKGVSMVTMTTSVSGVITLALASMLISA